MKYKNISEGVLKFRANDSEGIKKVFVLKPGEEIESNNEIKFGGLELVKEPVKVQKEKIKKIEVDE